METTNQVRRRHSKTFWNELKAAFLAGADLRPLARAAEVPEGSLLSRASREKWAEERDRARAKVKVATPLEDLSTAIAEERETRAQRHVERMERVTERVGCHVEHLSGDEALERISKISTFDRVARRTLRMEDKQGGSVPLINLAVLSMSGPSVVVDVATGNPVP